MKFKCLALIFGLILASLCQAAPRVEEIYPGRYGITGDGGYLGRGDGSRDYEKELHASDEGLLEFFETERVDGNSIRSWRLFWISSVQFIDGKLCLKFLSQAVNSGDGWVGSPLVVGFGCKAWDGEFTALEQQVILKLLPQLLSPLPDGISSDLAREMGAEVAGRPILNRGGLPIAARYSWSTVSNLMRNAADYLQAKNHARELELADIGKAAQHKLNEQYQGWGYDAMVFSLWGRGLTSQLNFLGFFPASAEIATLQQLALGKQNLDEFLAEKNLEFGVTLAAGVFGGGIYARSITGLTGSLASRMGRIGAGIAYEALQNAVPVASVPQLAVAGGRMLGQSLGKLMPERLSARLGSFAGRIGLGGGGRVMASIGRDLPSPSTSMVSMEQLSLEDNNLVRMLRESGIIGESEKTLTIMGNLETKSPHIVLTERRGYLTPNGKIALGLFRGKPKPGFIIAPAPRKAPLPHEYPAGMTLTGKWEEIAARQRELISLDEEMAHHWGSLGGFGQEYSAKLASRNALTPRLVELLERIPEDERLIAHQALFGERMSLILFEADIKRNYGMLDRFYSMLEKRRLRFAGKADITLENLMWAAQNPTDRANPLIASKGRAFGYDGLAGSLITIGTAGSLVTYRELNR